MVGCDPVDVPLGLVHRVPPFFHRNFSHCIWLDANGRTLPFENKAHSKVICCVNFGLTAGVGHFDAYPYRYGRNGLRNVSGMGRFPDGRLRVLSPLHSESVEVYGFVGIPMRSSGSRRRLHHSNAGIVGVAASAPLLCPLHRGDYRTSSTVIAMFAEVNALPSSECQLSVGNGNRQRDA